jgi:peptide chain release factor 2
VYGGFFDVAQKKQRLKDIEDQILADPHFWEDPKKSSSVLQEKKNLEIILFKLDKIQEKLNDLSAAIELAEEESEFFEEAAQSAAALKTELRLLELQSLLTDPLDKSSALVTINAGAGGTESCDWASMLLRMFLRFCERRSWQTEVHDVQAGEEAGIKNATFEVSGENVFGLLKSESGVHRLVRISPFDSNARRHTSFASVFISPVIDDEIEIVINPADLRVDTYRASGAGGQHVNRTDSAIRITHIPTNTVVQCQSQRSQHQNRDTAMKMLKSKLYDLEMNERKKKQEAIESQKADINFGSQIRSYVLHPYKLVKDHRTDFESHEPDEVLDGDLMPFIEEFLSQKVTK